MKDIVGNLCSVAPPARAILTSGGSPSHVGFPSLCGRVDKQAQYDVASLGAYLEGPRVCRPFYLAFYAEYGIQIWFRAGGRETPSLIFREGKFCSDG